MCRYFLAVLVDFSTILFVLQWSTIFAVVLLGQAFLIFLYTN